MAPDQTLLNYLVMRTGVNSCNLALNLPETQRTGNSVTSTHFEVKGQRVYDQGMPLVYLHYIGISDRLFYRLCRGENVAFPYREVFLHYRYRHNPGSRPVLMDSPIPYRPQTGWRRYWQPLAQLLHRGAQG
jgi:hypothetical protein